MRRTGFRLFYDDLKTGLANDRNEFVIDNRPLTFFPTTVALLAFPDVRLPDALNGGRASDDFRHQMDKLESGILIKPVTGPVKFKTVAKCYEKPSSICLVVFLLVALGIAII